MRSLFAGGLLAVLALVLLVAPAPGQDDEERRAEAIDEVMRDYRDDGVIEACDHERRALRDTLDELPPEADVETPDLRPALEAAIEQVKADECEEEEELDPTPAETPDPAVDPDPPTDTGSSGDDPLDSVTPLPDTDGGNGGADPLGAEDVTPVEPEVTAVPPAAAVPPAVPPAEPSGAPPAPTFANADDAVPVSLLVLAGLAALLALLALLYAVASRLGWGETWLAGARRTGREALFRAGGTWGDFADWLRVGR